jgi:hypothetical protein
LVSVALARNADGRLELFDTNSFDQIWHRSRTSLGSNTWTSWMVSDAEDG